MSSEVQQYQQGLKWMQEQPRLERTHNQNLLLVEPFSIRPGLTVEALELLQPHSLSQEILVPPHHRQVRYQLQTLQTRIHRNFLQDLFGRSLSGGGLSALQISSNGARVEISGLLSREGRRTPFLARGFFSEQAGPYGGVVFYDVRIFGRAGLPVPALIPLLAARTGRHGPVMVKGCITLQFDMPSLLLRWGLAAHGWKIPSYQNLQLKQIVDEGNQLLFLFRPASTSIAQPLAQQDPDYHEWGKLYRATQKYHYIEEMIGNGEYTKATQEYSENLWKEPEDMFLQERLMQLYIASNQSDMWGKAYRIAERILQKNPNSTCALNCMAQYAEAIQDLQTAANFYKRMGEIARHQSANNESSLAFGKAAELLERIAPEHAHELWQLAVAQNSNYRPAITALTRHALKAGHFTQAESILQKLIEQTPPGMERARYHLSLAGLYRSRLRNLPLARQQLDYAAPFLNEDLPFLRELAEFRLATDENIDALRILDRLANRAQMLRQPMLYADLLFRTGQILEERLGRPHQALPRYREVLQSKPKHSYATSRISALEAAGTPAETLPLGSFETPALLITEKEQALKNYQNIPSEQLRLHLELCRLYWQQQQVDLAIQAGQAALQLNPTHRVAWQLLEEICVRTNRQSELAAVHQKMVSQAESDNVALRHLEEALRLLPSDRSIIKQLSEYYDKLEEWDKLNVLYSRWLEIAEPMEHAPILLLQAQLLEHRLQRHDQAEIAFVKAYQTADEKNSYITPLIQYYIRHQLWEKLDLQIKHLAQNLETKDQGALFAEKGRLLNSVPKKKQDALSAYQKALLCDPENPDFLIATIDILRQDSHTIALIPLLNQLAIVTKDPSEELLYRKELAYLYDMTLSETEKAIEQYQFIVSIEPSDKRVLHRLSTLYTNAQQIEKAAKIYDLLLEQLQPSDQSDATITLLQQMVVTFERTGQTKNRETSLQQLLLRSPDFVSDFPMPSFLEELQSEPSTKAKVLFALGQKFKQTSLFLQAGREVSDESPEATGFLIDAGLQLAPTDPDLWIYRMQQATEEKRPGLWKQLQSNLQRQPLNHEVNEQLSKLFEELQNLNLSQQEIQPLVQYMNAENIQLPALNRLQAQLFERDGDLEAAISIRQKLAEQLPNGREKSDLRFELAIQRLRVLQEKEAGHRELWNLLAEDPEYTEAFYELQQSYDEEGQLVEFVQQLEDTLGRSTPGQARADLYLQAFELHRALFENNEDTFAFLERNVERSQDDPHTLQMLAVAYEEAEAFEKAVDIYRIIGEREEPAELSMQALEQAAMLYTQFLDSPDMALDLLLLLLAKDPDNPRAFDQLSEIYKSLWMWNELAELINEKVERLEDSQQAASLLVDLGEVYLGHMQDYEMALHTYRRALRKTPKNLKVLRALLALYEELQDWPAAVSALKATTRIEVDRSVLCDSYIQIAKISLDHLYQIDDTEKYYLLAHTQKPESMEPLEGLIALYEATDNVEKMAKTSALMAVLSEKQNQDSNCKKALQTMVDTLQRATDLETTPEAMIRSILQERQESAALAQRLLDRLREMTDIALDDSALLELHRTLSQLHQQHIQELAWLLRLWHASEEASIPLNILQEIILNIGEQNWSGVVQQLVPLQKDADSEDAASYQLSIAEIALYALEQPRQAKAFAEKALAAGAPPERALPIFESIQWKEQGYLSLQPLLEHVKLLPSPEEKSRALYHLAGTFLIRDGQWGDALQCLIEAASETPHGDALKALKEPLREMAQALDQDDAESDQIEALIPADTQEAHKHLYLAWICFQFQELGPGIQELQAALKLDAHNAPALRLLGHYLFEQDNQDKALAFFYHFIEQEWDYLPFDEVVELCTSLAFLYNAQQNWESAIFYLEQATQFIPEDPRILEYHSKALAGAARWDELLDLYKSHLDNPEPTDTLEELWYQTGQIYELHREDSNEALNCYQRALKINPEHAASLQAAQSLSQKFESLQ